MSTRSAGRWPVSRSTAKVLAVVGGAVLAGIVLARFVPSTRGGLFLLAGAAVAAVLVARDTGYRFRRR